MNRKDAREKTMQILFQIDVQNDWENPDFTKYTAGSSFENQTKYARQLLTKICANHERIDRLIDEQSSGWSTARMAKTDLAILRLATGEILFLDDVPNAVSMNEAVNLAKVYGEEQSPRFVNAVLSKINRAQEQAQTEPKIAGEEQEHKEAEHAE